MKTIGLIQRQNISRDTFCDSFDDNIVPETPLQPNPPPIPSYSPINFVETVPITPARLQGQRWRNWANTRLAHLPDNEIYTDEEIIQHFEVDEADIPNIVEDAAVIEPIVNEPPRKTITAKPPKEKRKGILSIKFQKMKRANV